MFELPKPVIYKGYPVLIINALGYELQFNSIEEVEHFIEVVEQKNIPNSSQLASARNKSAGLINLAE